MKISEVTTQVACEYLRISTNDVQTNVLNACMKSAEEFINSYTGLSTVEIQNSEKLTSAYLALIQDLYDNRGVYSDGKGANKSIESILGMHARNLL